MQETFPPIAGAVSTGGSTPESQPAFDRVVAATNVRGLLVFSGILLLASLWELAFEAHKADYRRATLWEIGGHTIVIGAALVLIQSRTSRARFFLPPVALASLLLLIQHTIGVAAWGGQLNDCYPLILLGIPVVFLFPPRVTGSILAVTTSTYLLFVLFFPPLPLEAKLIAARNAVLACIAAIIASKIIYDPRHREYQQRFVIESRSRDLSQHYARLDELMAVTAHDLRSPLLGLRNLVRLTLARADSDPSQALSSLQLADRSLESILVLVNGLLDAHEAERGALGATTRWDLRLMLADLIERAMPSAQAASVDIKLDVPKAPVVMVTDFHAVSRIIDNLLANAIRFSPSGSSVTIASEQAGGVVAIAVNDEGPGVPTDDVDRIFDKFFRGDMSVGDRQHGSGLGLFIARQIAENLDGTVTYKPNEPVGSSFVFEVPTDG